MEMCQKENCGTFLDLNKAPTLHITFPVEGNDHVSYAFPPKTYVTVRDGKTALKIADIIKWRSIGSDGCRRESTIGLGKTFLSMTNVLFEVNKFVPSEKPVKRIGFSVKVKQPRATKSEKIVLFTFISAILLAIAIMAFVRIVEHLRNPPPPLSQIPPGVLQPYEDTDEQPYFMPEEFTEEGQCEHADEDHDNSTHFNQMFKEISKEENEEGLDI